MTRRPCFITGWSQRPGAAPAVGAAADRPPAAGVTSTDRDQGPAVAQLSAPADVSTHTGCTFNIDTHAFDSRNIRIAHQGKHRQSSVSMTVTEELQRLRLSGEVRNGPRNNKLHVWKGPNHQLDPDQPLWKYSFPENLSHLNYSWSGNLKLYANDELM